jgi:hypothetical protein
MRLIESLTAHPHQELPVTDRRDTEIPQLGFLAYFEDDEIRRFHERRYTRSGTAADDGFSLTLPALAAD